ncbi:DedA family protein [Microbacterium oleivorans]|uniref:Putative membrane-associated protein n=1 Tax=Microbacterium oleivorans TaxID=273677 RepID=A0A031FWX7_9MICO|nr:DedA family protein [Microbacterium oleivorans]AZS43032.1 putative membrane protein [Microbacterium oleivorans]EZP28130.1 putative membrane-associated protein [Microbacterium oleivorans]THE08144.1 DedA family protein [Microbacterium oleivorans]
MTAANASSSSGDGSWLSAIADWVVSLMDLIGPPGAAVAVGLDNLFPPIPSEVILPLAGLAASRGSFTLAEAIGWTTFGSVFGAYILYVLGRVLGADRLTRIADRIPLVKGEDITKTVAWFERHGAVAVFFGRMVPLFRSLISIPAGVSKMPWWKFGLLTTAGSLIWNSIFVLAGFFLGENWHVVEQYAGILQNIVLVVVAVLVVWFLVVRIRAAVRGRRESTEDAAG